MSVVNMARRSFGQFRSNPLRTLLTLLGVVFGVGAVVAMMSIGEGAQRQIVAQIEAMGATSVHVKAREVPDTELSQVINDSMGLTRDDVRSIAHAVPGVRAIAFRSQHKPGVTDLDVPVHQLNVFGVNAAIFDVHALKIAKGRPLAAIDQQRGLRAAVLGADVARAAFGDDPIGEVFRIDYTYFRVVGVLKPPVRIEESADPGELLDAGDESGSPSQAFDADVYANAILIPHETLVAELHPAQAHNELDMISVKVATTEETLETKRLLGLLLSRLHGGVNDYEITAPEEILRQKQATQSVFNTVLISIAAISLLVGGIGVMNIMLANIMERVSEIGLRRAIGARRRDIRNQFLLESVAICVVGGALGVAIGIASSWVVSLTIGLPMAFAWESTALAFFISLAVGVTFGLMPAIRAANIDPIEALRGE
jgi:putative ABC transport system permease protein